MRSEGPGAGELTSVDDSRGKMPTEYALMQNYPNPFNPTTNIQFRLQKAGDVTLKIYNIRGQLVTTLVDAKLEKGTHKVSFDASGFSSGVYFYRIKSGDFNKVKKMMFLK
jgi:hypothetical protein